MSKVKIRSEFVTILIAFIAAMSVWLYVANMKNPIETKLFTDISVELVNLDKLKSQDISIMSNSINKISVAVKGRFTDLQKFSAKDISAEINLENLVLEEGKNIVNVNIGLDNPNIDLVPEKTNLNLELQVEKIIHKDIQLTFQSKGSVEKGYVLGDPILSEEKITCSGTKNDIDSIKQVIAQVDVSGKNESFNDISTLKALNKNGDELKGIMFSSKEISVDIPIYFKKEVPIRIAVSKEVSDGYKLIEKRSDVNKVVIYGEKEKVEKINEINSESIDLSRRYSDFERFLDLEFPEGIKPLNSDLTNIYVSFIIEKSN